MKKKSTTFKAFLAIMLVATILPWNVASAQGKQAAFDPFEKSINEVSYALNNNQTTSEELVEYYLKRIEAFDDQGPTINAVTMINDNAIEQAKALDAERKAKGPRSELHGIPFVVKDNIDVVGMPTTAGSVALKNEYPSKNSFVVQKLIDAGAIVIGKTNMSELAASYGRLGYSSFGGQTLNPYNLNRDASGSSSGSAAAVAANFAVFGLGTDTSGSVRGPAHTTGLVGIRPTMGLASRTGVVPSSLSLDVVGPMARSVEDASIILAEMAGKDKADKATKHANRYARDYASKLNGNALKHARIGVATEFFGDNAEVDAVTNQAIAKMQSMGTEVVPVTFSEQTNYLWTPILGPIDTAEFKSQFETYLSTLPAGGPKTLAEVIAILESPEVLNSATPANPARVAGLKVALEKADTLNSKEYKKIVKREVPKTREEIEEIMDDYDLDAIVFPTMSCPASNTFDKVDPTYVCNAYDTYAAGYMASATGFPEVTVPAGTVEAGMPVGISFFGTAFSEQKLLNLAYSFEQATHARTVPVHAPNLNQ